MTECREIDVMTFNLGQLAVSRACLGFMSTKIFSTHMLLSVGPPYVCVPNNIIEVNEIRNRARVTETDIVFQSIVYSFSRFFGIPEGRKRGLRGNTRMAYLLCSFTLVSPQFFKAT